MQRVVTSKIRLDLASSADLVFQVALSQSIPVSAESLTISQGERRYEPVELIDYTGSRLHRVTADAGPLILKYQATVVAPVPATPTSDVELIRYLRPSRYSQADEVFSHARRQFAGLRGLELISAVEDFVAASTTYAPGLSYGTDSAVTTLTTGRGVCRDYAHLVIALLRALDIPARYLAGYAPGLEPMDFHAIAEAFHDGTWHRIDATGLSDPELLLPIATGRDAADCAFLSFHGGHLSLIDLSVDARISPADAPILAPAG